MEKTVILSCSCKSGCKTDRCGCRKAGLVCQVSICKCADNCCNTKNTKDKQEDQNHMFDNFSRLNIKAKYNDNKNDYCYNNENKSSISISLKDLRICNCKTLCENNRCYCRKNGQSCDVNRCGCCTKV